MNKEDAFNQKLAEEVSLNQDDILEKLQNSQVGQCGGSCRGWQEEDLKNLCPTCLKVLEEESDGVFSSSPMLKMLGDVMNTKD